MLVSFPFRESLNYWIWGGGGGHSNSIRILSVCFLIVNCLLMCPRKFLTGCTMNWTVFRELTAEAAAEAALGVKRFVGMYVGTYRAQWQVTAKG